MINTSERMKSLKDQGNEALLAKKYDLAIQKYTEGIKQKETNEKGETLLHILFANRSQAYIEQKKYLKALVDAQESLNINPQYEKAQHRKASCMVDLKMIQDLKQYDVCPKEKEEERKDLLSANISNNDQNQPEYIIFGVHRNNPQLVAMQGAISLQEKDKREWEKAEKKYFQNDCFSKTQDNTANEFIKEIVASLEGGIEREIEIVSSAILKHHPNVKEAIKQSGNKEAIGGCWGTVALLAHLCSWGPKAAFLSIMEPLPALLEKRAPKIETLLLQKIQFYKPIHLLRVYKNSRDCVLYSMVGMLQINGGGHGCSMIQFPSANGPIYRVVQSFGNTYSISQWLNGHGETPFSSGWLNFDGAKAFWARVISFYISGQDWLAESNHNFCFGCPPPENCFNINTTQNNRRSNMFFDCTPFDIDVAFERLRELQKGSGDN